MGDLEMTAELLRDLVARTQENPHAPALRTRTEIVTYAELAAMAAHAQAEVSTLSEGPVTVLARKSPEAVALVLGCLAAGRPVLLPPVDLGLVALRELCERAGCAHVLTVDAEYPDLVTKVVAGKGTGLPEPVPVGDS
ncbi:MAG: fatty acid--CoA ligase, partial [Nonomuraea sp.]|nr:fatty acid--CoA ligase [Nonomuraea sp.]